MKKRQGKFKWDESGSGRLLRGGKPVPPTDIDSWCQYAIQLVESGASIWDIPETEAAPLLATILRKLDEDYAEELAEAKKLRLKIHEEHLVSATNKFRNDTRESNKELLVQLEKSYSTRLKNAEDVASIIINFYDKMPDKFWDTHPPEAPLSDEDRENWKKLLDAEQS